LINKFLRWAIHTRLGAKIYLNLKWIKHNKKFPYYQSKSFRVLLTKSEIQECLAIIRDANLSPHRGSAKNWDSLIALNYIKANYRKDAQILDAGAEYYSVILPWLNKYGYHNLTGNNLTMLKPVKFKNISYEFGDITSLGYKDNYFDVITCLSVIEHGIDLDKFFIEMHRVLLPGGVLIVSTDYYESKIETNKQYAYGVPIKIFSKESILRLIEIAKKLNFELVDDINLTADEKVVHWKRFNLRYTFIIMMFCKTFI
jgi:SAM-dependent methyltransferase